MYRVCDFFNSQFVVHYNTIRYVVTIFSKILQQIFQIENHNLVFLTNTLLIKKNSSSF